MMRDPYLYDDVDVLKNIENIKDSDTLRKAEADIINLAMLSLCCFFKDSIRSMNI